MATTAGASSSETYDAITHFGLAMPGWVQSLVLAYTHYGLVLVAPFFAWLWWRARGTGSPERMAAALLVPAATVVAYVLSEIIKAFVHEQRPCRGLPPEAIVGVCPPPGDWSFPSNHSTIAAAVALGGAFAWRKGAPWLAAFAATMGFSRVFVGAHYPHDVLIGLALGAGMALLLQRYALGPAAGLVRRFSEKVPFGLLGVALTGAEPATVRPPAEEKPRRPRGGRPDDAPVLPEDAGALPQRGPVRPAGSAPRDAAWSPGPSAESAAGRPCRSGPAAAEAEFAADPHRRTATPSGASAAEFAADAHRGTPGPSRRRTAAESGPSARAAACPSGAAATAASGRSAARPRRGFAAAASVEPGAGRSAAGGQPGRSPVAANSRRFATDTAWSAKRS